MSTDSVLARTKDAMIGTWRLVSWYEEETAAGVRHCPFGAAPVGFLTYTADGRMMVLFADPTRRAPAAPKPTDAEAAHLHRTMSSYAGTYIVEAAPQGAKVTHNIELSWNQAWNGTPQIRFAAIHANRLTITTAAFISPVLGTEIVSQIIWDRVA